MFTNGTGTGKTFTGLGIIKRLVDTGKKDILIVVPSKAVADGWVQAAKFFGLKITALTNTKDPGEGVSVTQYANFYQNRALAMRDFDLVVLDESHKTGSNQAGVDTQIVDMMRALTGHERGRALYAQMMEPDLWTAIEENQAADKAAKKEKRWDESGRLYHERLRLFREWEVKKKEHDAARAAHWEARKTRVLFLSATPFATEKNTTYAEGFLFDFPAENQRTLGGYSHRSPRDLFFIQHFGWRFRQGKLTQPGPEVDRGLLQRQFNMWLRQSGSLRARRLDVPFDYSREFVAVDDLIGNEIDKAIEHLRTQARRPDRLGEGYAELLGAFEEQMDFHERVRILEAIKAKHAVARIRKHLALGRKVVVFHSYNQGGANNPFVFSRDTGDTPRNDAIDDFRRAFPDLPKKIGSLPNPLDLFKKEFGDQVAFMNGLVSPKKRLKDMVAFNRDESGIDVIVVQEKAGGAGISLHDTTGKHPRVNLNINLPFSPVDAIQIEGRIYRVGQASDAIFEYFNTGTLFERSTFAGKIAGRIAETDNLSLGDEARRLKESFIESFEAPVSTDPGPHQGKGGKAQDARDDADVTAFDKARTYYFMQEQQRAGRYNRLGADYFPTPEPLGYKLVEWLEPRPGEAMLEPSAGHGAIARFFPETTKNVYVEPSDELASRLLLVGNGTVRQVDFLGMDVGANKADGIVMNPPYGVGGKTAFEHLTKAARHLNDGGRLIALLPAGPAADARLEKILDDTEPDSPWRHMHLRANVLLPRVTFNRAGTAVLTRLVVFDKVSDPAIAAGLHQRSAAEIQADTVAELFDKLRDYSMPSRPVQTVTTATTVTDKEDTSDPIAKARLEVKRVESASRPWLVVGRGTYEHRGTLYKLGGRFDQANKAWAFTENPTEALRAALVEQGVKEDETAYGVAANDPTQLTLNLDLLLDELTDDKFRPEATEVDRELAREAVTGLVENAQRRPSLLASALPRDFVAQGPVSLVGQRINGPEDLATLAQVYRDPRFETLRYFFVKDGEIVGQTGVSSRLPGYAAGWAGTDPDVFFNELERQRKALGAWSIWMLHNHPSGSSAPSLTDANFTRALAKKLPALAGHVVIDHNNYALISPQGDATVYVKDFPHRYDLSLAERPHPFLGWKVADAETVALIGRSLVHGSDYAVAIARGGGVTGEVTGLMEVPLALLDDPMKVAAYMRRFARQTRGVSLFLVVPPSHFAAAHKGLYALYQGGAFLDVVSTDGGTFVGMGVARAGNAMIGRTINRGVAVEQRIAPYRIAQRRPGGKDLDTFRAKAGLGDTELPLRDRIKIFLSLGWAGIQSWLEYQRDLFAEGMADKFRGLLRLERMMGGFLPEHSPYVAARLTTGLPAVMRAILLHGAPEWRGGVIAKKANTRGLIDLLDPVEHELDDWIGWMVASRAKRLMGEGRENLFTPDEIDAGLALAKGREQRFQDVADEFAAFKRSVLDLAEQAGLIDPASRAAWDMADWIPFYRIIEQPGGATGASGPRNRRGLTWQSSGIRQLRGGEAGLVDPLENIVLNFAHLLDASLKNHAARLARDEFASLNIFEELTPAERMAPALVPLSEVKRAMKDLQIPTAGIPAAVFDGIRKMWSFRAPTEPDVVRIMDGGKAKYYRVLDDMLLRALTGLNEQAFGGLMRPLRAFKRALTGGVTADPAFMLRNFIRDSVHAWLINPDKMRGGIDSARGLVKALRETGGGEAMLFAGASFRGGYLNATDPGEVARVIRKALRDRGWKAASISEFLSTIIDTPAKLWERYREIGDAIENASREATYEATLKAGRSPAAAAFDAKDLMDFSLRGRWAAIRVLTDMVPFTNARIQGLYKLGRSGTLPGPQMRARVAARGFLVAAASVLLMLLNDDDERYLQLEEWQRDTFWHFWIGGHHFAIPKPFELGLLYGTLPERLWRWAAGDEETSLLLKRILLNTLETLSLDPTPQAIKPLVEVYANRDSFTQRPIESLGDERKPPSLRYNANTSDLARVVGGAVGDTLRISPKQIEHLVRGYFGMMGMYALNTADAVVRKLEGAPPRPAWRPDEIPVLGSFWKGDNPPRSTRDVTDFYDLLNTTQELVAGFKELRKSGRDEEADRILTDNQDQIANRDYLEGAQQRFRAIRREMDDIHRSATLTPAAKRTQLDALYAERNALAQEVAAAQRAARKSDEARRRGN